VLPGRAVLDGRAEVAEAVEEAVADVAPVAELDAELEAALRLPDEVGAVQAQGAVVGADGRQRGFADADGADVGRLHQHDLAGRRAAHLRKALGQRRGRHPAGGAAAHDDDLADGRV